MPADRSGVLVNYRIQPVSAASVVLHDAAGNVLALGSSVELDGSAANAAFVGYDGIVYLEGLTPHNALSVHTPTGDCSVRFDYRHESDTVPVIGPLVCRPE